MKQTGTAQKVVVSGVFIALATVLSLVVIFKLPYGGSPFRASLGLPFP